MYRTMARMYSQRSRYSRRSRLSRNGRRSRYTNKYPTNKSLNQKVKKIQDMIELKFVDSYFNNDVGNTGSDFLLLNGLASGTGASQREGNEITATSLQIRGAVTMSPEQTDPVLVRMIVFWDRQANGANPVTTTVSPDTGSLLDGTVISDVIYMPFSYQQQDRYRILYDKTIQLNPKVIFLADYTAGDTQQLVPVTQYFKKKIKLGRKTKYDTTAASGLIDNISTNSLFVVFYSDTAANSPLMQFGARMYFKDA